MVKDHVQLLCNICNIGELNQIFSESTDIKTIFQKIINLVVKNLKVDVCSIYIYDENTNELTLKATKGLNSKSVGKVKLKLGDGIAGYSLKERRVIIEKIGKNNPHFKAISGINEEFYESFLAIPILRGISRIGVLMLQRDKKNYFKTRDIMVLKAVASQLANLIENTEMIISLHKKNKQKEINEIIPEKKFIKGKPASEGYAYSNIIIPDKVRAIHFLEQKKYNKYTLKNFNNAVRSTEIQLENLQKQVEEKLSDAASLIFTAHLLILKDKEFTKAMTKLIQQDVNPPQAILQIGRKYVNIFSESSNPYIQEKVQDIEDLIIRLMGNLTKDICQWSNVENHIIIAKDLFPSDILKLTAEKASGIILISGGVTSHLSILARSLQIPLIIIDELFLLKISANTKILMDADLGNIYLNPSSDIIETFKKRNKARISLKQQKRFVKKITRTKDNIRVKLMANINLLSDLKTACELHLEGIGLYRTEFPFLIRRDFPSEEEQLVIYKKLIEGMPGKEITFRTLDIGGDKVLSYYQNASEKNPFLGMRSIRFSLQNKEIFKQQIRAMLRADEKAKIKIMFPMISSLEEFLEAKNIVFSCIESLKKEKLAHNDKPKIGMMVELPSVVEIIDDFARESEFFSIGTNDFIQYMLAVDRTNEKVASLYLPYHPSVLRAIKKIVDSALKHKIEISVCGDMAHQEKYIPFLLGIGIRMLSLDPIYFPKIQKFISQINLKNAENLSQSILKQSKMEEIIYLLNTF